MLKEKEKKITENLRNMGMSLLPHYLEWFFFYHVVLIGCSLIWTIIAKLSFFKNSNFLLVWWAMLLPGLVMLSLAFIVCSFFVTAKSGALTGIVVFFVFYGISIGKSTVDSPSESTYAVFALSPFTCINMVTSNMVLLESTNNFGFGFMHISLLIEFFRYRTLIIICLFEYVIFFLLGIYLDQVWPSEIGIRKHPLFCIGLGKNRDYTDERADLKQDEEYAKLNYEKLTQQEQLKL